MKNLESKKVLSLRVVMDDEFEDKFNKVKNELGLNSNAEVVRFLVHRFYKEITEKGGLFNIFILKMLYGINPLVEFLKTLGMDTLITYGLIFF